MLLLFINYRTYVLTDGTIKSYQHKECYTYDRGTYIMGQTNDLAVYHVLYYVILSLLTLELLLLLA